VGDIAQFEAAVRQSAKPTQMRISGTPAVGAKLGHQPTVASMNERTAAEIKVFGQNCRAKRWMPRVTAFFWVARAAYRG